MPELPRPPRTNGQLLLTRGHLYAFGAMSVMMAALSFFVGVQVGRGATSEAEQPVVTALLDEEARTGQLETLLMRVEAAHQHEQLVFPEELPRSTPPLPPLPEEGAPIEPPTPVAPIVDLAPAPVGNASLSPLPATAGSSDAVPDGGWAVQVAVRDAPVEADLLVETLRAAGLPAYRVDALVDGRAEHRVRVGGYSSEAAATAALPEVRGRAGASSATVSRAP